MLNLYDVVYELINPILDSYAEHYPADIEKTYPYAEFNFPNVLSNNEFSDLNQLYIDIWDNKSGQVEEIEAITDNIFNILNKQKISTDDMYIQIYRDRPYRVKLNDPDINIQRRELRFIVKVYKKK